MCQHATTTQVLQPHEVLTLTIVLNQEEQRLRVLRLQVDDPVHDLHKGRVVALVVGGEVGSAQLQDIQVLGEEVVEAVERRHHTRTPHAVVLHLTRHHVAQQGCAHLRRRRSGIEQRVTQTCEQRVSPRAMIEFKHRQFQTCIIGVYLPHLLIDLLCLGQAVNGHQLIADGQTVAHLMGVLLAQALQLSEGLLLLAQLLVERKLLVAHIGHLTLQQLNAIQRVDGFR